MESRKLVLRRERLVELTSGELSQLVGGSHLACATHGYSCDACPVPTLPINECIVISGALCTTKICVE